MEQSRDRSKGASSAWLTGLGWLLIAAGAVLFFTAALPPLRDYWRHWGWQETVAVIDAADPGLSVAANGDTPTAHSSVPVVRYRWTVAGREYAGSTVLAVPETMTVAEGEELCHRLRTAPRCWHDPADPGSAVLARPGWHPAVLPGAGALLLAAGGWGFLRVRHWREARGNAAGMMMVMMMGVFFVGCGVTIYMIPRSPARAEAMQQARATVVSSRVYGYRTRSRSGGSRWHYRPDTLFRYTWQGQVYHSNERLPGNSDEWTSNWD